jgi:hypothetical protein
VATHQVTSSESRAPDPSNMSGYRVGLRRGSARYRRLHIGRVDRVDDARLTTGQTVLIHGAAGGVNSIGPGRLHPSGLRRNRRTRPDGRRFWFTLRLYRGCRPCLQSHPRRGVLELELGWVLIRAEPQKCHSERERGWFGARVGRVSARRVYGRPFGGGSRRWLG